MPKRCLSYAYLIINTDLIRPDFVNESIGKTPESKLFNDYASAVFV